MATRVELVAAISCRYVLGGRAEKARMLDEFVALTGFHRKHAMRLLRGEREPAKGGPRPGRRVYGDDVRAALVVVWEASDRICGKRLHPLLPTLIEAMERHGHAAAGDLINEGSVRPKIVNVPGAAHQESITKSFLEMAVRTFDRAVLVGDALVVARRRHPE